MSAKKKAEPAPEPSKNDPNALTVSRQGAETSAEALAHAALHPTIQAALTLKHYNKGFGVLSLDTLMGDLKAECEAASSGNLKRAEGILIAQAHTLDAIFNNLARRAALNMGEYINAAETYMRLALKAQAQNRATLETLAAIKNPQPVAFVRQANIAHGPQQVNNAPTPVPETSRAWESENQPNRLLEQQHGERLDTRTARATSGPDLAMATLEEIHRPEVRRR